jgi:hypothetical protein
MTFPISGDPLSEGRLQSPLPANHGLPAHHITNVCATPALVRNIRLAGHLTLDVQGQVRADKPLQVVHDVTDATSHATANIERAQVCVVLCKIYQRTRGVANVGKVPKARQTSPADDSVRSPHGKLPSE